MKKEMGLKRDRKVGRGMEKVMKRKNLGED